MPRHHPTWPLHPTRKGCPLIQGRIFEGMDGPRHYVMILTPGQGGVRQSLDPQRMGKLRLREVCRADTPRCAAPVPLAPGMRVTSPLCGERARV